MAKKLQGYAAELARDLKGGRDVPRTLDAIKTRLPGMADQIFATLSPKQRHKLGLAFVAGHIVQQEVAAAPAPTPAPRASMTPVEAAAAIRKLRQPAPPQIDRQSTLYVRGYGQAVRTESVAHMWHDSNHQSYRARIDALRRGPGIVQAEVSTLPHDGVFAGVEGNAYEAAARHATNIIEELTKVSPQKPTRVAWRGQPTAAKAYYGARLVPATEGEPHIVVARSLPLHAVMEVNAWFGRRGKDERVAAARRFTLLGCTAFAADPELLEVILDGGPAPSVGADVALDGTEAEVVAELIEQQDTSMLAPAYTSFTMRQDILFPTASRPAEADTPIK